LDGATLMEQRYQKFRALGAFEESSPLSSLTHA
jgi:hypothetical protein